MKRAMLGIGDRMLAALLPREDAAACVINKCTTTCVPHGQTNCEYICTQVCRSSSGQVCYTDSFCSN